MTSATKISLSLAVFFVCGAVAAQDEMCKLVQPKPEILSWIPETPSYFAKVHPEGHVAYYIGMGNQALLLEEPNEEKRKWKIPGSIDPVPCPDGRILTVPGLEVYAIADVMSKGETAESLLSDPEHYGVYQSCALLKVDDDQTTYRIVTDDSGKVAYRDYRAIFKADKPPKVEALGSLDYLCPEQDIKTIIISKTAKYVGGYTPSTGTTQIFDVSEKGVCRSVLDFGYPTGKLEFNYDDTKVTFHVDYFQSQAGGYFSGVSSDVTKDVFVVDLVSHDDRLSAQNMRRLSASTAKGSGSYYPSFTRDGRVAFINDDHNFYSFQLVKPERAEAFNFYLPPPDGLGNEELPPGVPKTWKRDLHAAAAIGALWAEACSPYADELSAVEAAATAISISPQSCRRFVNKSWSQKAAKKMSSHPRFSRDLRFDPALIGKLTDEDLLQVCPEKLPEDGEETRIFGDKMADVIDGPKAIHHYCVGCHVGNSSPGGLDFENLTPEQIHMALERIARPKGSPGAMPPGGFDTGSDGVSHQEVVVEYLNCLLEQSKYDKKDPKRPYCGMASKYKSE